MLLPWRVLSKYLDLIIALEIDPDTRHKSIVRGCLKRKFVSAKAGFRLGMPCQFVNAGVQIDRFEGRGKKFLGLRAWLVGAKSVAVQGFRCG